MISRHYIFIALIFFAPITLAHEQGDWLLRAGHITVDTSVSSDVIDVAGLVTLPGVDVDDNSQLGITTTYMLRDNWGIELLAATPFSHDIEISDIGVKAGDTKQLPPTLMLQYYPDTQSQKFSPYVGIGLNSTIFFDEDVDNELNLALDGIVGLPAGSVDADLSLKQSWGLSVQIGFDYMINDNWLINAAIWYTKIETEARVKTAIADVKFDVELDPTVYLFSLGYRF